MAVFQLNDQMADILKSAIRNKWIELYGNLQENRNWKLDKNLGSLSVW